MLVYFVNMGTEKYIFFAEAFLPTHLARLNIYFSKKCTIFYRFFKHTFKQKLRIPNAFKNVLLYLARH